MILEESVRDDLCVVEEDLARGINVQGVETKDVIAAVAAIEKVENVLRKDDERDERLRKIVLEEKRQSDQNELDKARLELDRTKEENRALKDREQSEIDKIKAKTEYIKAKNEEKKIDNQSKSDKRKTIVDTTVKIVGGVAKGAALVGGTAIAACTAKECLSTLMEHEADGHIATRQERTVVKTVTDFAIGLAKKFIFM